MFQEYCSTHANNSCLVMPCMHPSFGGCHEDHEKCWGSLVKFFMKLHPLKIDEIIWTLTSQNRRIYIWVHVSQLSTYLLPNLYQQILHQSRVLETFFSHSHTAPTSKCLCQSVLFVWGSENMFLVAWDCLPPLTLLYLHNYTN